MAITFNSAVAISHIAGVTDDDNRSVTYSLASGPQWIYCNYPEQFPVGALGDYNLGNKYLNRVYVYAGTSAELFASYRNMSNNTVYFGVQCYTPKSDAGKITVAKSGYHNNPGPQGQGWSWVTGQTAVDFLKDTTPNDVPISGYGSSWIIKDQGPIKHGDLFNCYIRFTPTVDVWCFPYVYKDFGNINGTATLYSGTPAGQKRGLGSTCFINANLTYNVSELPVCYPSNSCQFNGGSDMIAINDQGTIWDCSNTVLGNWGAHYFINVTIVNNTSNSKVINASVGGIGGQYPNNNCTPVIKYGTGVQWVYLAAHQRWNWLTDTTLAAGTQRTYSYEYIQAANSNSPTLHSWVAS